AHGLGNRGRARAAVDPRLDPAAAGAQGRAAAGRTAARPGRAGGAGRGAGQPGAAAAGACGGGRPGGPPPGPPAPGPPRGPGARREAEARIKAQAAAGVKARAAERADTIRRLLSSTGSALILARALGEGRIPTSVRPQVLAAATASTDPQVRDLFERFVPDD